ncbi:MAG: bifunctional demethylmenaquinone methyltransferase/2-methoxy-6-polyprenyl-1,4-benzoquinol methylase UbiE [Bacteroidales bacterium]|nr:bifunctional demethylmenaquinone methyltransferase/2-methoxy-6-polyprenyl-1,4-benzoquinol methylase UbiE [Bacteroidales bacterium]MDD4671069.1 bifunctional demethylmenaquinone methyltransferase/2-methoxy-6-polyprenyl-1,4-benzoquinol methylase UbiE [Bacteroidales bacterium]
MSATISKESSVISKMFNDIADKYDLLNHTLSFGIDKLWRKKLIRQLRKSGAVNVLDLACGTGDLTIALAENGCNATGMDIADKMLLIAEKKAGKRVRKISRLPSFLNGSAEDIPFEESSFDAVTISFGIRNFDNREQCLEQIYRVIKPGGGLYILEFAIPENKIWKALYLFYFKNILPLIGRMVSKDRSAYSYLPESVMGFPQYEAFSAELGSSGFKDVTYAKCSGGIALLYIAKK